MLVSFGSLIIIEIERRKHINKRER